MSKKKKNNKHISRTAFASYTRGQKTVPNLLQQIIRHHFSEFITKHECIHFSCTIGSADPFVNTTVEKKWILVFGIYDIPSTQEQLVLPKISMHQGLFWDDIKDHQLLNSRVIPSITNISKNCLKKWFLDLASRAKNSFLNCLYKTMTLF